MPRYEYACTECATHTELDIPLKNYKDPQWCITCGTKMSRVMGSPRFKVNGFSAANGYASKAKYPPGYGGQE